MWHPVASLPPTLFWPSLGLTLLLMAILRLVDRPLRTPAAPRGIVSLELAGDLHTIQIIIDSWDSKARVFASFSLGLDYLFMFAYAVTITMACIWAAGEMAVKAWPIADLGIVLAWGVSFAALCDGLENFALWRLLVRPPEHPWPTIAFWSASIKFFMIFLALLYVLAGGLMYLLDWA